MAYTFTLTTTIPATPQDIYEAWLDSIAHSAMTGGEANMSAEVGAEVSAWDGYISGRNLELIPGERIVQSWRTSEFEEHEDSIVTIVLQEVDDGTLLTLQHSNVPDAHRSYEEGGWQSNYFEPMTAYFVQRKRAVGEGEDGAPRKEAVRKLTPRRAVKHVPARSKASSAKAKKRIKKKAKAVGTAASTRKRPKRGLKVRRGRRR